GTQAPNDPCIIALPASIYARDYTTGKSLISSGGATVASIYAPNGAVGGTLVASGTVGPGGVFTPVSFKFLISKEGPPGSQPYDINNPITGPGNRLSWR